MNVKGQLIALVIGLAAPVLVHAADTVPPDRDGKTVVDAVCSKCHATGVNGAPRIGDQPEWRQRLKRGIDATARSAIAGHGSMPARGGMASLTDVEVRNAILYMFNPADPAKK